MGPYIHTVCSGPCLSSVYGGGGGWIIVSIVSGGMLSVVSLYPYIHTVCGRPWPSPVYRGGGLCQLCVWGGGRVGCCVLIHILCVPCHGHPERVALEEAHAGGASLHAQL